MDLETAIRDHRLLQLRYHGHARVVEPHIYGIDGHGHAALSAYQIGGGSESGQVRGWKLFHVDEIERCTPLSRRFDGPRQDYNPGDASFVRVIACV